MRNDNMAPCALTLSSHLSTLALAVLCLAPALFRLPPRGAPSTTHWRCAATLQAAVRCSQVITYIRLPTLPSGSACSTAAADNVLAYIPGSFLSLRMERGWGFRGFLRYSPARTTANMGCMFRGKTGFLYGAGWHFCRVRWRGCQHACSARAAVQHLLAGQTERCGGTVGTCKAKALAENEMSRGGGESYWRDSLSAKQ